MFIQQITSRRTQGFTLGGRRFPLFPACETSIREMARIGRGMGISGEEYMEKKQLWESQIFAEKGETTEESFRDTLTSDVQYGLPSQVDKRDNGTVVQAEGSCDSLQVDEKKMDSTSVSTQDRGEEAEVVVVEEDGLEEKSIVSTQGSVAQVGGVVTDGGGATSTSKISPDALRGALENVDGVPGMTGDTLRLILATLDRGRERGGADSGQVAAPYADEASTERTGHVAGNSHTIPNKVGARDEAGVKGDDSSDHG